tara:strand:+ start:66 stop:977 length:912 start_codon:yes stop_codon:yes gene_type:complete
MKILLNFNNNKKKILGGIETLNQNLFNKLKQNKKFHIEKTLNSNFYDAVISSNDARIFNKVKTHKKILWIHNQLQIEKAFRKRQFFPLIKHRIHAIFVSKYLKNITSNIYRFDKRIVIPNFLDKKFENIKISLNRKPIVMWCVSRDKGLNEVIKLWKNDIIKNIPNSEFHIFGVNKYKQNRRLELNNIFFHGKVSKKILIKFYKKSVCSLCLGYDETFCLNAIESMSCGTPVLSFNKTSLKYLIKNNINGFKVNNFLELTNKIKKLLLHKKKNKSNLIKSTYKFSKRYYFSKVEKKWMNIIKI